MPKGEFKTTFYSTANCPIEENGQVSYASLSALKSLIPDSVLANESLLPFAGNLFTSDLMNRNGDCLGKEETLKYSNLFLSTRVDLEHNPKIVIGNVTNIGYSTYNPDFIEGGDCEIISEDDIKDYNEIFNVCISGVLYKGTAPNVIDRIIQSTDVKNKKFLSIGLSWEIRFTDWVILLGSSTYNGKIINDETEIEKYAKFLRVNKGKGKLKDGTPVNRLIIGEICPLGIACTLNPAANVRGVVIPDGELEKHNEEKKEALNAAEDNASNTTDINIIAEDPLLSVANKNNSTNLINIENNISLLEKPPVTPITDNKNIKQNNRPNMKFLESFAQLETLKDEDLKSGEISFANLYNVIKTQIKEVSEKWAGDVKTKEGEAKAAVLKAEAAEKAVKEATEKTEALAKEVEALKVSSATEAAKNKFQLRMSGLDNKYDLNDADRAVIAKNINGVSDEDFADYAKDCEVIFASKVKKEDNSQKEDGKNAKGGKKNKDDDMDDDDEACKAAKIKKQENSQKEDGKNAKGGKGKSSDADDDGEGYAKKMKAKKAKEDAKAAKEAADEAFARAEVEFDQLQNNTEPQLSLMDKYKNAFSAEKLGLKVPKRKETV